MKVKIKKLHQDAITPKYAKPGDAGLDFTCIKVNEKLNYIEYETGIAIEVPYGYVGLLFPRSSISDKGLILANSVGVVDSGYRGPITFRFKYLDFGEKYNVGDRIGQMIIIPYRKIEFEVVEELSDSERGINGYGSTNIKEGE